MCILQHVYIIKLCFDVHFQYDVYMYTNRGYSHCETYYMHKKYFQDVCCICVILLNCCKGHEMFWYVLAEFKDLILGGADVQKIW